jgi:hypothetical protein
LQRTVQRQLQALAVAGAGEGGGHGQIIASNSAIT